jgi:hypothetical protein
VEVIMAAPRPDRLSARPFRDNEPGDPRLPAPAVVQAAPWSAPPQPAPTHAEARAGLRQAIVDRDAALQAKRDHDARVRDAVAAVSKCRGALRRCTDPPDEFATTPPPSTKDLRKATEAAERALQDAEDDEADVKRGAVPSDSMKLEGYWVKQAAHDVLQSSPEAAALKSRWEVLSAEMSRLRPAVGYLFGEPALNCVWNDSLLQEWKRSAAALEHDANAPMPRLPEGGR